MIHLLFLALALQPLENSLSLVEVFEVHTDHAICFQGPVQAIEAIFVFFFKQSAERVKHCTHCELLLLPGIVLIVNLVYSDNLCVLPFGPEAQSVHDSAPLEEFFDLHLMHLTFNYEVQVG